MPQLVGSLCAICGQPILSILHGDFCPGCGHAVHGECRAASADGAGPDRCATCGLDLTVAGPPPRDATRNEMGVPVGRVCPQCGGKEYRPARSRSLISVAPDRLCLQCGTQYSLPTPRWAAMVFLLIGLVAAVGAIGGAWVLRAAIEEGRGGRIFRAVLGMGIAAAVAAGCVFKGLWALRHERPPATRSPAGRG